MLEFSPSILSPYEKNFALRQNTCNVNLNIVLWVSMCYLIRNHEKRLLSGMCINVHYQILAYLLTCDQEKNTPSPTAH